MMSKFSFEPTPRPPETTLLALCRSGRSLLPCFSSTKRVCVGRVASTASASIGALLAPVAAAGHEAERIVATTVWAASASTVMIALPA